MMLKPYQTAWLQKFTPLAQANQARYGVPALFTLAQQLVESSWSMTKLGNNFFGVKAHGWAGPTNLQKTHEYDAQGKKYNTADVFRAYSTPAAAYEGHAQFLLTQPRYRAAFQTTDPVEFAQRIAKAGYATSPDYFKDLRKNIFFLLGKPLPASPTETGTGMGAGALLLLVGAYLLSRRSR